MLIMKRTNPVAVRVMPLAGQQLPPGWDRQAASMGGTFDRRDLSQLWREPQWTAKPSSATSDNIIQQARLTN